MKFSELHLKEIQILMPKLVTFTWLYSEENKWVVPGLFTRKLGVS